MESNYIVKYQTRGHDKKWGYRYIRHFSVATGQDSGETLLDDWILSYIPDKAAKLPEPVAEWLCQLLQAEGLYPEMEKI